MIPVTKPDIGEAEMVQISEALESGWIGYGPKVQEFERKFGNQFGYDHVVATNAGTNALDLALKELNPEGNEVLVPSITWISTAFVAVYNGYDVGWIDVSPFTLNLDPTFLEQRITDDTAAVIPVHYGGQSAEIDQIVDIAHEHNAAVIEDCAHAPGATYDGKPVGSIGDAGCFSFQATKPLTTGEGGAFVTNDEEIAQRIRRRSKLGVDKSTHERSESDGYDWYYEVTDVGYKYFMHDISAGIGLAQLDRYQSTQARRKEIAAAYQDGFGAVDWISALQEKDHITHARYNYTIRVPRSVRNDLIKHLDENDIGATVHYMPLYKHPVFDDHDPELPVTESVWEEILTLPMASTFSKADVRAVIKAVTEFDTDSVLSSGLSDNRG